jgi:hypothetical protein
MSPGDWRFNVECRVVPRRHADYTAAYAGRGSTSISCPQHKVEISNITPTLIQTEHRLDPTE